MKGAFLPFDAVRTRIAEILDVGEPTPESSRTYLLSGGISTGKYASPCRKCREKDAPLSKGVDAFRRPPAWTCWVHTVPPRRRACCS